MKISACVIVKNEEKNIETCINSYKEIVDEIIVVDTGSEDKTVEIAENLGAKVYFFKWINDFAAAKNYAIDRAKGDWIIFLDADEYFDANCIGKIKNILKSLKNTRYTVVGCKLINIDKVNNNVIDSFLQARIFKNDINIRYKYNIHETLSYKNNQLHLISYYDEISIYHTGYSSNINKEKAKRNLEILLDSINRNGEKPENYRYLCDCYFSLEDYSNALKYGELHLNSNVKMPGYQSRIYKVVIDCMWRLGKPKNEIEEKIKTAMSIFSDHPNFYCTYAFFLSDEKRYEEALNNLLTTIQYNEEYEGIEVNFILGLIPAIHFKIGSIYDMKNCYEKALEYYCLSLNKEKYNKVVFNAVFRIIKKEKAEDILAFLNSIYDINNEKNVKFIIDELMKIKPKEILAYYTSIWYKKFGHEDSALTFTLLAGGKYETTFNIFHKGYLEQYENSNAIFSIVSALLSENKANIESLLSVVKPSYKRILMGYGGQNNILLEQDVQEYIGILIELMQFNKDNVIDKFLKLKDSFEINILSKIAKTFMDNHMYEKAVEYYEEVNKVFNHKEIYLSKGFCYYKLKQYKAAYVNLKKAIEAGYVEKDVFEFFNWTKEQCGDLM